MDPTGPVGSLLCAAMETSALQSQRGLDRGGEASSLFEMKWMGKVPVERQTSLSITAIANQSDCVYLPA